MFDLSEKENGGGEGHCIGRRLPSHLTLPEVNRRDLKRFCDSLPGKAVRSSQGRTGGLGGRFPEVPVPPHLCKNKH